MTPVGEPMVFKGIAENKVILGGRFLESNAVSGEGETRIESKMLLGFDRRHGEYTAVGFDTMGTYFVTDKGKRAGESGSIRMYGEDEDPILKKTQKYFFVVRDIRKDGYVIFRDFHEKGKDHKLGEITYTRRK